MEMDRQKFEALVLYVLWKTSHIEEFGTTKLNKVLWFAEARAFEALGQPITGETFVRDKYGPRSKHLPEVCKNLEERGLIQPFTEKVYDYEAKRFRALQPADTSQFTNEELSFVDWWISTIADKHTAVSISKLSHDYGWEVAGMGEELPIHAFLAKRIREPETEEELTWARKEAERLGLVKKKTTPQAQRFVVAARDLGCDESESSFEKALKSVASVKPKPDKRRKAKRKPKE